MPSTSRLSRLVRSPRVTDQLARAMLGLLGPVVDDLVNRKVKQALAELAPVDMGERLLTVRVAAERVSVGETTLRRWITDGRMPTVSIPGRVVGVSERRIRQSDLDTFVRALSRTQTQRTVP